MPPIATVESRSVFEQMAPHDSSCNAKNKGSTGQRVFTLDGNVMTKVESEIGTLARLMKQPKNKVSTVNLLSGEVTDDHLHTFAEALKHPQSRLLRLSFRSPSVGNRGARFIADAISHPNCRIQYLSMSYTTITDEGARMIAQSIKMSSLKRLTISSIDDGIPTDILTEIDRLVRLVWSSWFRKMVALCSARHVPRLGCSSGFGDIPNELIRLIADTLPLDRT